MFVLSRNVSASFRVIATLVATALVMWGIGLHSFAQAANVVEFTDTLSDSAPAVGSDHTIYFESPSGVASGGSTIVVTFPTGADEFDLTGVTASDIDLEVNGTDVDTSGTAWSVAVGASTITFTSVAGSVPVNGSTTIQIGTNAAGGVNQITNPDPADGNESYEIEISAGADTGFTRVVILDTVLVTAAVNTTFEFTVIGNTGSDVNGEAVTLPSSSTTIPFGVLDAGAPEVLSQDLTVQTNAINGFVVTVESDGQLESATGADIDNFVDDTIENPQAWAAPSNDILDENTWGHWGVTSEDTVTTRTVEFGANEWQGVTTTPTVLFSHDGPADGFTPGAGSTTVGYQIEISPLQEAAQDYSAVLTYIATPTF